MMVALDSHTDSAEEELLLLCSEIVTHLQRARGKYRSPVA